MSKQTVGVSGLSSRNQIPDYARGYAREYQLMRGLNNEIFYLENNIDFFKNRSFKSKRAERIKKIIRLFKRGTEKGKLRNINEIELKKQDLPFLFSFAQHYSFYKEFYNVYYDEDCREHKVISGLDEFYDCTTDFFSDLLVSSFDSFCESDSDSDSD